MSLAHAEQRLRRVLRLALFDALSLVAVAAPAATVALSTGDRLGAAVGSGITLCGAAEWLGHRRLLQRRRSGIGWLCTAQLLCLLLILLYAWKLAHSAQADRIIALLPDYVRAQMAELFPGPEFLDMFLLGIQQLTAAMLALVSLLYQGGMAFYYLRSAPAAHAVFAEPPTLPSRHPRPAPSARH